MSGQLFHELSWKLYPIEGFQLRGNIDFLEFVEPFLPLIVRERSDFRQFPFMCGLLGGKLEIVINQFAEQSRHKAEG